MRYQTTTELTPRQVLEQALADFGPDGVGLQTTSQTNLGLVFQAGGGHIAMTAQLWRRDDVGTGDSRVGLCRAAVHGAGATGAAPGGQRWRRRKRLGTSRPVSFTVLDNS